MTMEQSSQPNKSGLLFPMATNFTFATLNAEDAKKRSDNLHLLGSLLSECSGMYPAIDTWYRDKVIPGLRTGQRVAYIAFEGDSPIASAVMKQGEHAKFCHLRIHEEFRDEDLGRMFFTQMALEARHQAKDIHFTLPESLWASHSEFFRSFGFESAVHSSRQYRNGEEELACAAPLPLVWERALQHLPKLIAKFQPSGYSLASDLILSIHPKYAEKVFAKSKTVEIRKSFSTKWVGKRAVVYATHPSSSLMGEVRVCNVIQDDPRVIWETFGSAIGCTAAEYVSYVGAASTVWAINLEEPRVYKTPLGIANVSHLIKRDLKAPQSYCGVAPESDWSTATSVASLLHGRFRTQTHV